MIKIKPMRNTMAVVATVNNTTRIFLCHDDAKKLMGYLCVYCCSHEPDVDTGTGLGFEFEQAETPRVLSHLRGIGFREVSSSIFLP